MTAPEWPIAIDPDEIDRIEFVDGKAIVHTVIAHRDPNTRDGVATMRRKDEFDDPAVVARLPAVWR